MVGWVQDWNVGGKVELALRVVELVVGMVEEPTVC